MNRELDDLLLRAHGGAEVGAGHVMRLAALGLAWQESGGRASLLVPDLAHEFQAHLEKLGIEVRIFRGEPGGADDAEQTLTLAQEIDARWIAVDGYVFAPDYIRRLASGCRQILLVDDGARTTTPDVSLVVDAAFQASELDYSAKAPSAQLLLGPSFALLRPEFQASRRGGRDASSVKRLLVTLGGSDPVDASSTILQVLADMPHPPAETVLIVGGLNPRSDAHFREAGARLPKLTLVRNSGTVAKLMASCDAAIAAAGATVHELAAMGLPAVLVPIAENQFAGARHVSERGWFAALPPWSQVSRDSLHAALRDWLADAATRRRQAQEISRLVDGRGAVRVVQAMQAKSGLKRRAKSIQVAAILGSGPEQLHAIHTARSLGIRVLAFDRNAHSPGLAVADEAHVVDPADEAAVEIHCRAAGVEFLLPTPMGALLETAGRLNESMSMPGLRAASARLCADKLAMREVLRDAGLAQPVWWRARGESEIRSQARSAGWPLVLKPRMGSGSHGVVVVDSDHALDAHLDWHRRNVSRFRGAPETLIEEWIAGPEFGLDAAMVQGRFHALCLRRKEITPLPFRLALGVRTPPGLGDAERQGLLAAAETACRALALDDCLVHVDLILQEGTGRAVVIELSGRPSGFRISSQFVPAVTGCDPVREMIRHLQGGGADFAVRKERAGIMRMLSFREGRVLALSGLAEAQSVSGIYAFECLLRPGDVVKRADSGSAVLGNGYLIAVGDTLAAAESSASRAASALHVETEPLHFHNENIPVYSDS